MTLLTGSSTSGHSYLPPPQGKIPSLTSNQKNFLRRQLSLWAGHSVDPTIPLEYAFLLLGGYEASHPFTDYRGNKDFQHNPLFWGGAILEPVISQWLISCLCLTTSTAQPIKSIPLWPGGKTFAVCLTHDVDLVNLFSVPAQRRFLLHQLRSGGQSLVNLIDIFENLVKLLGRMAYSWQSAAKQDFFSPWLELEDRYSWRSTFFFFPDRATNYHKLDGGWYRFDDSVWFRGRKRPVCELMRILVNEGWEIGLHGTFLSFNQPQELREQKRQVEQAAGEEIVSIRQHRLHFDFLTTPRAQCQAGFKFDSTVGFNRLIGFRQGHAWPIYHYDINMDQELPLIEVPLIIQDGALFKKENLDLTPESALQHGIQLVDKVERVGGVLTLLWHANVSIEERYPGWFWVYEELLRYISLKPVWVATVKEIGFWWEHRSKMLEDS